MVYTSSLGTHTFFMTQLPLLFFFGYPKIGRAYVICCSNPIVLRLILLMHFILPFIPSAKRSNLFACDIERNLDPSDMNTCFTINKVLFKC